MTRRHKRILRAIIFSVIVTSLGACAALGRNCGFERQPVKVAADRDAELISHIPHDTTIAALTAIPAPRQPRERYDRRYAPVETATYRLRATLRDISYFEEDGDYDLILADQVGRTMIAEAPNPACAAGSRFSREIAQVQRRIEARFRMLPADPSTPVTVTGIGFFDVIHDVPEQAPNGIELHPILAIEWR